MENLKLSQIYIGKTDAKDELNFGSDDDKLLFERTFYTPPTVDVGDYSSGKRFYVLGLKGAGKTALLRYLDIVFKRQPNTETTFVLFKSDFSSDDLKELGRGDDSIEFANSAPSAENFDHDYENVWRWFIHRHLVDVLEKSSSQLLHRDDAYEKYVSCVKAADSGDAKSGIKKLFPKFTKGQVEISKSPNLKIEFDWSDAQKTKVSLSALVRQADNLFKELRPKSGALYFFVDEIELKLGSKKQYERDCRIIRDLIVSVHKFNQFSHEKGRWLKLIAAVRSEVLSAVVDFGKEIEKPIADFGRTLSWYEKIPKDDLHLLLQVVCHKILKTETGLLGASNNTLSSIWGGYFRNGSTPMDQQYILHKTWFRPRDVVRLLNLVQAKWPDKRHFEVQMINDVMKEYSTQSWREIIGELAVRYDAAQQRSLSHIFTKFQTTFSLNEFASRIDRLSALHSDFDALTSAYRPADILTDLYRLGALGNVQKGGVSYAFRETGELDLTSPIGMHQALWPRFNIYPNKPGNPRGIRSYTSSNQS